MSLDSNTPNILQLETSIGSPLIFQPKTKSLARIATSVALLCLSGPSIAKAPAETVEQAMVSSALGVSDALAAIDKSRSPIVKRIVADYATAAAAKGISAPDLRALLMSLRADELLAATLVNDIDGLVALLKNPAQEASGALRYQPVAPAKVGEIALPAQAQAVLIQQGEAVSVSPLAIFNMSLATHATNGTVVLGYFEAPATNTITTLVNSGSSALSQDIAKDGVGSGANSWIGYTAGGNLASGPSSAVAAGSSNAATAQGAFVGSGTANVAGGISSLVIGGFDNRATAIDAMVGSGAGNRATGARSIVVGGGYNVASGDFSFVGGGGRDGVVNTPAGTSVLDNIASGLYSVVVGGRGNRVTTQFGVIGGGRVNQVGDATGANGRYGTISGGNANKATSDYATVGGGLTNTANGNSATVGGGGSNTASGDYATVGGGDSNSATGFYATVAGGYQGSASGANATVVGGYINSATRDYSFAAGSFANADQKGCAVFAFWSSNTRMPCLALNNSIAFGADRGFSFEFETQRADGGGTSWVYIGKNFAGQNIATSTGAYLSSGGIWTNNSDRASKENFQAINGRDVLAKLEIGRAHV